MFAQRRIYEATEEAVVIAFKQYEKSAEAVAYNFSTSTPQKKL